MVNYKLVALSDIRSLFSKHKYFLLFIFLFAYIQSIESRLNLNNEIDVLIFTPESAVVQLIGALFLFLIMNFLFDKMGNANEIEVKNLLKIFVLSILIFLISSKIMALVVALSFGNFERNFNTQTLSKSTFMTLLDAIIYGSFYLSYYYFNRNRQFQEQLAIYNQALTESKILQLKNQINPHFLFNNLNVLDQLIDENKMVASEFLNEFSEVYRYILEASDRKITTIKDEVEFAEKYFSLIKHKYGNAYILKILGNNDTDFIVPFSLQLLIENAIKHNVGTVENPIVIEVTINNPITVNNNINLKKSNKIPSGKGLKNLIDQYQLLSNQNVEIKNDEKSFKVSIPLIPKSHDQSISN